MKIILDTSALLQDPWMRSAGWEVLVAMASSSFHIRDIAFVLPEVVWMEIGPAFERELTKKNFKDLGRLLADKVDASALRARLLDLLESRFTRVPEDQMTVEQTRSVIARSLDRHPPCSANGEQLRDALIWEAVREIVKTDTDRKALFFVGDGGFWSGDGPAPELVDECKKAGIDVTFFRSLSKVIGWGETEKAFVTPQWLEIVLVPQLMAEFCDFMKRVIGEHLGALPEPLTWRRGGRLTITPGAFAITNHSATVLPDKSVALWICGTWQALAEWEADVDPELAGRSLLIDAASDETSDVEFEFVAECIVSEAGVVGSLLYDGHAEVLNLEDRIR